MCLSYIGTANLIKDFPALADGTAEDLVCSKNTGNHTRMRKWSRGHQFIVRGGGHIDNWQPLYM